ncbi:type I restriction modification DNA specificity domain protein [Bacteroides fragilis str. 1007-1-F |jgi:type I restriction enzyme S subunit|uniref:Type I restriction modification DNA specificity domain protein n=1 Tax=Bacteroides fragilis str. 1007-1-F \|nr:restriction endonuclease subunit S [Bacteroides fragilis]EXZ34719.1 type I restriction modification DNA specificity domain protein [Bacteroides fragilis str. 1007-1-F \
MADNKNNSERNVPPLRFPEFSGEWKKCTIGGLTIKVGSGVTPRGGEAVYKTEGHPFVRSQNVGLGHLLLDDIAYIDEDTHQRQKNTELQLDDVLLNITGASIGRSAIVTKEIVRGNVNQHVCIIRTKDNLVSSFLCNFLLSNYGQKQIDSFQAGGNRQGLNFEQIKSIKIAIPTVNEQSKIAQLLQLVEERIATQNKIIEDLKKLKSAISESLFKSIKGDTFVLSEICDIVKGKQVNGEYLSEIGEYYVMNGGTEPSGYYNEYNVKANTISISEGGNSCGYVQFNKFPFWSGGHCYSLQNIPDTVDNLYLYHYLKSKENVIMKLRIGSGLPNIQKKDLAMFKAIIPPIDQQITISTFLSSLERKVEIEERIQNAMLKEKQYLLHQMFI